MGVNHHSLCVVGRARVKNCPMVCVGFSIGFRSCVCARVMEFCPVMSFLIFFVTYLRWGDGRRTSTGAAGFGVGVHTADSFRAALAEAE